MESNLPDRHTKQGNHAGAAAHTHLCSGDSCPWQLVMAKAGRARIRLTWLQTFRTKLTTGWIFSLSNQKGGNLRRAETPCQNHHLLVHIQACLGGEWSQGSQQSPDTRVWWEQSRLQRCPGCRSAGLHSLPLGMARDISPAQETNLTPNQGHALAQKQPDTEAGVGCALGRHTKHLHTRKAAQPRAEQGHCGLHCCQHTRAHLSLSTTSAYKLRAESLTCSGTGCNAARMSSGNHLM